MGEPELTQKLASILVKPIDSEPLAMYFMVQSRKLLDRRKARRLQDCDVIRFYADWCVHTEKDHITKTIKNIMQQIVRGMTGGSATGLISLDDWQAWNEHVNFIQFKALRKALIALFDAEYHMSVDAIDDPAMWKQFIYCLVRILVDQPIKKPVP